MAMSFVCQFFRFFIMLTGIASVLGFSFPSGLEELSAFVNVTGSKVWSRRWRECGFAWRGSCTAV
jgi:hypothetical protein